MAKIKIKNKKKISKKPIKKMDGESGANLVLGDSMNMFGADGLNNFDFSQGTNPNPAYTDASNFNLNQQGNQDNFNYEDWLNQGMGSPQMPNPISTSPYVNRIMTGVKAIADGTNNGNDAQAVAGGLKVFMGAGALGANTGGKMLEGYNTQKQENNLMYNQLDGAMANSYTFRNKNVGTAEHGKFIKSFENKPKNTHNVEYEGGEGVIIPTENGYFSDYVGSEIKHGDKNPNSVTGEGISANLPDGTYVATNKLQPKEVFLYNKNNEIELTPNKSKKTLSKVLKPYLETSMKKNPYEDEYSKNSLALHKMFSEPILSMNAEKNESDKLSGVFGEKVKKNAMKDYEMKYGGSVRKMGTGGLTQEEIDLWRTVKYGDVKKNPKLQEIAKKVRESGLLGNAWKEAGITGDPGNDGVGFTDDEILSSFNSKGYDLNRFLGNSNTTSTNTSTPTTNSVTNPKNTNMTPFESTPQSRKKAGWWGDRAKLEDLMTNFESQTGVSFPYYAPNVNENVMASDYQKAFIKKHPQIITNLFKNKALPFTNKAVEIYNKQNKTTGQPSEQELSKFFAKNPNLITEQFGDALWGERGVTMADLPFNSQQEYDAWKQDKDWLNIGNNYFYDSSGENDTPIVYKPKLNFTPSVPQQQSDVMTPINNSTEGPTAEEAKKYGNKPVFGIPRSYARDPEMLFQLTPEEYVPQRINPQLISRPYRGNTSVDRSIAGQDYANDYMTNLNAINQAEIANTQTKNQASQFNIQNRQNINAQNLGYKDRFATNILQGKANVTQQQMLDQNALINAFTEMDYEGRRGDMLKNIYDPNALASKLGWVTQQMDKEKATKKKFGGKVKIKAKKKK